MLDYEDRSLQVPVRNPDRAVPGRNDDTETRAENDVRDCGGGRKRRWPGMTCRPAPLVLGARCQSYVVHSPSQP